MGVRIDNLLTAQATTAPASATGLRAIKTSVRQDDEAGGRESDFGQVLARAQPRKKESIADGETKQPAEATKSVKKQGKAKGKDQDEDDTQVQDQDESSASDEVKKPATDATKTADDTDGDQTPADGEVVASDGVTKKSTSEESDPTHNAALVIPVDVAHLSKEAKAAATGGSATPAAQQAALQQGVAAAGQQLVQSEVKLKQPGKNATNAAAVQKDGISKTDANKSEETDAATQEKDDSSKSAQAHEIQSAVQSAGKVKGDNLGGQPDGTDDGNAGDARAQSSGVTATAGKGTAATNSPVAAQFAQVFHDVADGQGADKAANASDKTTVSLDNVLASAGADGAQAAKPTEAKALPTVERPQTPEARFAEVNHPTVVTAVKAQLLPNGGTLQLRLDPPDLGPLRLEVKMQDGEMSASFVTASDQATSLLTHSLGDLKHALEGAGISVDKLQVRQGSAEHFSDNTDQRQQQGGAGDSSARQEQQRREMLNRMWQKVAGGDPLDLVA